MISQISRLGLGIEGLQGSLSAFAGVAKPCEQPPHTDHSTVSLRKACEDEASILHSTDSSRGWKLCLAPAEALSVQVQGCKWRK